MLLHYVEIYPVTFRKIIKNSQPMLSTSRSEIYDEIHDFIEQIKSAIGNDSVRNITRNFMENVSLKLNMISEGNLTIKSTAGNYFLLYWYSPSRWWGSLMIKIGPYGPELIWHFGT